MSLQNRKNSVGSGETYERRSYYTDPYKLPNIYSKKLESNSPYECLYKICRQLINYFPGTFGEIVVIKNEINDYLTVRMKFYKDNVSISHLREELCMHKFYYIKDERIILTSFDLFLLVQLEWLRNCFLFTLSALPCFGLMVKTQNHL